MFQYSQRPISHKKSSYSLTQSLIMLNVLIYLMFTQSHILLSHNFLNVSNYLMSLISQSQVTQHLDALHTLVSYDNFTQYLNLPCVSSYHSISLLTMSLPLDQDNCQRVTAAIVLTSRGYKLLYSSQPISNSWRLMPKDSPRTTLIIWGLHFCLFLTV